MGITLSFRGQEARRDLRAQALTWARAWAKDQDWGAREVHLTPRLGFLRDELLERPVVSGVEFLPHFASEPVPLVFAEPRGILVDSYVEDRGDLDIGLNGDVLVKTQFAGADTHREVCEFLRELRSRFLPGLEVDDEAGFFEGGEGTPTLEARFAASLAEIVGSGIADAGSGTNSVEIGGFEVELNPETIPAEGDPEAKLDQEAKNFLRAQELQLKTLWSSGIYRFGPDLDGLQDLELLASDLDGSKEMSLPRDQWDDSIRDLVGGLGSAFGTCVAKQLGGRWFEDPSGELILQNVGSLGLLVRPLEIAIQRLERGPAFGFELHFSTFTRLLDALRASRRG